MSTDAATIALARQHQQAGDFAQAEKLCHHLLQADPGNSEAWGILGVALQQRGHLEETILGYYQALEKSPDDGNVALNLRNLLHAVGRGAEAEAVENWQTLMEGTRLQAQGRLDDAAACYRRILQALPHCVEAHYNLGTIWTAQGLLDDAVVAFQQALRVQPDHAESHSHLALVLKDQGLLERAIQGWQRALQLKPQVHGFHTALLGTLHYCPGYDRQAIFEWHRRWEQEHVQPTIPPFGPFGNEPSPERRLRIGYVSADFRDHVIGRNVWPLLRHHDHQQFDITLYSNQPRTDALTEQFRKCADSWCDIVGWSDDRVADKVREDGIDILVDLALHTADNRLPVFARKPAPVQVAFAGYPGTTGLSAIDYRLTDPYLDPPGLNDAWYAETSYRLPHSFWCYDPQTEEPAVAPLPALTKGFVTFGCLNNFCKINDGVLELWARILRDVEGSRLLVLASQGSHRRRTRDFLARQGIARQRVEFASQRPRPEYLALYHQLDIGLDSFPYNGHTTSLDSYWMGVPVITLVGSTVVGRAGWSQLTNLGLQELAAQTPERFVELAVDLAADLPRLEALRNGLRQRLKKSPLMDAIGFTRGIEQAYREMWRKWCAGKGRAAPDRKSV